MMVCVLKARMAEDARVNGAQTGQEHRGDRGSDAGDGLSMESCDTEPACACACHCNCMIVFHDTGTGTVFDSFAQEDTPDETLDLEGLPNAMHEHVVQTNSLDDEVDDGFD